MRKMCDEEKKRWCGEARQRVRSMASSTTINLEETAKIISETSIELWKQKKAEKGGLHGAQRERGEKIVEKMARFKGFLIII